MKDLQELTRFSDRMTFLYLEKGRVEQHQSSIAYVTQSETVPIPAANLALLMLGPGTTITHAAIHNLADCNCLVAWCGDEGTRFYCFGRGGTYLADKLLQQADLYCNPRSRAAVVRWMIEPKAGIFLGRMTARLRDKLWQKAVDGSQGGACLQAWSSPGEQGFVVRTHGDASRKIIRFEGLDLVSIPRNDT